MLKMIANKKCLICHEENEKHEIRDIYDVKHKITKESLEKILQRRLFPDKFNEYQVCCSCMKSVDEFENLQRKILQICHSFKSKFDLYNPAKRRGRKRAIVQDEPEIKDEVIANGDDKPTNSIQEEEIRKSNRKRKIKEIDDYVNPESDSKIFSKNATKPDKAQGKIYILFFEKNISQIFLKINFYFFRNFKFHGHKMPAL